MTFAESRADAAYHIFHVGRSERAINRGKLRLRDTVRQDLRGTGEHLESVGFGVRGAVTPEAETVTLDKRRDFVVVKLVGVAVFCLQCPENILRNTENVIHHNIRQRFVPALAVIDSGAQAAGVSRGRKRFVIIRQGL